MTASKSRGLVSSLAGVMLVAASVSPPAAAFAIQDDAPRIAVVSAYAPEIAVLKGKLDHAVVHSLNGVDFSTGQLEGHDVVLFLSGVSIVNTAMTVQLALNHFNIRQIVFSGIAGGVDPALRIGDVVIADRWGQYLESLFAREIEDGWDKPEFFEYPYANFGMMFPRSVTVQRAGADEPETRFWFQVDEALLAYARQAASDVALKHCTAENTCLEKAPEIVIGGSGVSGGAFIDNADFRDYAFRTFGARVLDMGSAAAAHVAYANDVPFIAIRSLSDLAGGGMGKNEVDIFYGLAADNAAEVVKALLRAIPE